MAEIRINTTGGLKLYDADNSHYAQIVAGTITSNVDAITLGHDTVTIADNLSLGSDSAILKLGADGDATLTHDGTTGLTIAATPISIDATGELHLNSTTGDIKLQDGGTDQIAFDLDGTAGEVIMKPAVDSDDLVISQYDGTEVIRIEDNASLGLVGNKLSIANSSSDVIIKPQHAVQRLYEITKDKDTFITTEVGQHQMWAAQHYKFNKPNRWMTSGGLGTMGYGLPAAVGVQIAHPKKLVIDIAGEASVLMTMQEMSTAVQYNLPIKIFILNNQYMGMVRQWQELLHEKNYSESYSEALPDFIKMAEAYGCKGIKADKPDELDEKIKEMVEFDGPVIFDCRVDPNENCFPMIPSGKPHNQMILGPSEKKENKITGKGKALV